MKNPNYHSLVYGSINQLVIDLFEKEGIHPQRCAAGVMEYWAVGWASPKRVTLKDEHLCPFHSPYYQTKHETKWAWRFGAITYNVRYSSLYKQFLIVITDQSGLNESYVEAVNWWVS